MAPDSANSELSEPRGAQAGDEVSRLRHTSALNAEIVSSLRALRERELHRSGEQAALLAAVSEQIRGYWAVLVEHSASSNAPSLESERATGLIEDLVDYTRACAGTLTLERESIHLGRFLRQLAPQLGTLRGSNGVPLAIRIHERVPEWVVADAQRLCKVLTQLIAASWGQSERPLSLEIALNEDMALEPTLPGNAIVIAVREAAPAAAEHAANAEPTAEGALRAALVQQLRDCFGISVRQHTDADGIHSCSIALVLEASQDPVQAREFERASAVQSGIPATAQPASPASVNNSAEADSNEQGAIDFTYLDRQLGSLAQLVLTRTAPAFLALADERLTTLVVAQEMEDLDRMRDLAQAWKASAMSVGARPLASLLGSIEKQAAAGNVPGAASIRQVKDVLARLRRALAAFSRAPGTQA